MVRFLYQRGLGRATPDLERKADVNRCPSVEGVASVGQRKLTILTDSVVLTDMSQYSDRRVMMVDTQVRPSDVTKFPVIEAMLNVPRENFVPDALREVAYMGENVDLGNGRVLLDPRTMGKMLDALDVQPDDVVLDIGCGLGYSSALLARMSDAVVAVEDNAELAAEAQRLLSEVGADNAAVFEGDLAEGAAKHGPYDAIVVQGAVEDFPSSLAAQLKEGGRAVCIFAEGALGVVRVGHKMGDVMNWRNAFNATAPIVKGFETKKLFTL